MIKPTKGYLGDILLLCLLAFPLRLAALFQTPYANGWDAYFYLIQIKSWIEEGAMHSSDSSLIYPLLRLIHWFSGDYVLSFKITSAFLATAFVVLIYIWGRKTASYGIAILLTFYFLWSPHLTWFAAQYPKNLLGVNLLLLFFIVLKKGERFQKSGSSISVAILLLIANYFGHRMTFVLSGIYFVIYFFGKIISENDFLKNAFHHWKKGILFFVGALLLVLFVAPFFSGTLSFFDLERIGGAFSNQPHFAPLTFFNEYNDGNRLSLFWKIEIGLSVVFYFVGVLLLVFISSSWKHGASPPLEGVGGWLFAAKEKSIIEQPPPNPLQRGRSIVEKIALFILCSILIFPFLKWSLTSMSFRLVLVFIFLSPIFFISTLQNLEDDFKSNIISLRKKSLKKPVDINPLFSILKSRGADLYPRFLSILLKLITPVSILLLVLSFFSWKSYNPQLHDAPYEKYDRVTQVVSSFLKNKNPELVIAHNALAEYFTFTTGIDALPWQPEYEIAEDQLWRIAADVRLPIFRTYLSEADFKNLKRIGVNYYLIQESVWQKFKDNLLRNNELEILEKINTWRNPYRVRPNFLLQKKKKQDE